MSENQNIRGKKIEKAKGKHSKQNSCSSRVLSALPAGVWYRRGSLPAIKHPCVPESITAISLLLEGKGGPGWDAQSKGSCLHEKEVPLLFHVY